MKIKDEAVLTKILKGADVDELVSWLTLEEQLEYFKWLKEHGAKIEPNPILKKTLEVVLTPEQMMGLLEFGADPVLLASKLHSKLLLLNLELLVDCGLEPEKVYKKLLSPKDVVENLEVLAEAGVFVPRPELIRLRKFVREH